MTILVTGGAGFIGSHVARALLARGDRVAIVDDFNDYYAPAVKRYNAAQLAAVKPVTVHEGDIRDAAFLARVFEREKPDKVCHLAARAGVRPSLERPVLYEQVNVQGTLHLLALAVEHRVKSFVYASSSSVYGNMKEVPFREDARIDRPVSPYAATKLACELFAYTYHHLYGLHTTGLRFFTVYGPAGRPDMAPFLFTRSIMRGEPVRRFGDGTTERDYTFIDDIVQGVVAALDRDLPCEIINLGNCRPVALNDFIRMIAEAVGKAAVIREEPMQPGDVERTCADTAKARRLLGYEPHTPFEQGIRAFVAWYREHQRLYA